MIYLASAVEMYSVRYPEASHAVRAWEESYKPVLSWLSDCSFPTHLSLNWSLVHQWEEAGLAPALQKIQQLVNSSRVSFLNTSGYHAVLPLLPQREIVRQLDINVRKLEYVFPGITFNGLFPTELAFGNALPPAALRLGIDWTLADDIAYSCAHGGVPWAKVLETDGLPCVLRSSFWSQKLATCAEQGEDGAVLAAKLIKELEDWFEGEDGYLVLALESTVLAQNISVACRPFYKALSEHSGVELVAIDDVLAQFPQESGHVPPGSWLSNRQDLAVGDYYAAWQGSSSETQALLWELTELAVDSVEALRDRLDRSLASGTYWWSSEHSSQIPEDTASGVKALLELISQAQPNEMGRALELVAELELAYKEQAGLC